MSLPASLRQRLRGLPLLLQLIGMLAVVFALARPIQRTPLARTTAGIDVLLCLDISSSMAAQDLDPSRTRLDVAKEAAARFVAERREDRIGLLRFARYPDLVCPLTLDHRALQSFLGELEQVEADGDEDLTGVGTAIARASQLLGDSPAKSKVVILLTDGVETVATADAPDEIDPLEAAQLCAHLGVRTHVIAAGRGVQAADGRWVDLDTSRLQRLAQTTRGQFFEVQDARALSQVYAAIDGLEKAELDEPRFEEHECFLWPLLIALVLIPLAGLLRRSIWGSYP